MNRACSHGASGRRRFLRYSAASIALAGAGFGPARAQNGFGPYVCPPCGCDADGAEFGAPGSCPACGMTLQPKNPPFEPAELPIGASLFLAAGGIGHEGARIGVHTYRPESFTPASPILIVVPGDGRNGAEYRDAWVPAAETYGVLIAALAYPNEDYDFAAYHMGGVIRDLRVRNMPGSSDGSTVPIVRLNDEDISFNANPHPETWLFNDFDRIFDLIATATASTRTSYDLFGHSAGGQILHRAVLFQPRLRARRIVAANAGLYSQPDPDLPLLAGLRGTGITEAQLAAALGRDLTILLGALDNNADAGGTLLRTPELDRFGIYRLERGRRFHAAATARARALGATLAWKLETVPDVGHDFRAMSRAASLLLYGR